MAKYYIRLAEEASDMKVDSWDYDAKEEQWFGVRDGVRYEADYVIRIEDNEMYYVEIPAEAKITEEQVEKVDNLVNEVCDGVAYTCEELDYLLCQLQELKHRGSF